MKKQNRVTKYIIGCDFAYRPNWFIRQLQKIGFYKNKGKDSTIIWKKHKDGVYEQIKIK